VEDKRDREATPGDPQTALDSGDTDAAATGNVGSRPHAEGTMAAGSEGEGTDPAGRFETSRFPFYIGTIVRVNYGSGSGVLRTGNGREIRFLQPFVDILDGRKLHELTEGMQVGFDVGWTSRGLRVTLIKFL
jgi:hypothetical protein